MKCILCASEYAFETVAGSLRDSDEHSAKRCQACGLVQLSPMPTECDNSAYYDRNEQQLSVEGSISLQSKQEKTRFDTDRRVALMEGLIDKSTRILDVGCGYGFVVLELRSRGYDAIGCEPSSSRAEFARSLGVPIVSLPKRLDGENSSENVDFITMFQVLEHISDPSAFLEQLRNIAHPGARLLIEVPNFDDHLLDINPHYRSFYWQRAHVAYYSAATLLNLLKRSGWDVKETLYQQRYGVGNLMHWMSAGTPQIAKPDYLPLDGLAWLDTAYREHLTATGRADTLIVLAQPESEE